MKKLLVAVIGLSAFLVTSAALAETPEGAALARAVRVARTEPKPVAAPRTVPAGCAARTLLSSTFQTVIVCR